MVSCQEEGRFTVVGNRSLNGLLLASIAEDVFEKARHVSEMEAGDGGLWRFEHAND
jgi:hypothetical protein